MLLIAAGVLDLRLPNPYGNDFSGVSGLAAELFFFCPASVVAHRAPIAQGGV